MDKVRPPIEVLLLRVLMVLKDSPRLQEFCSFKPPHRTRACDLEDLAGNHAFDDHPQMFRITLDEGHDIRHFFQTQRPRYNKEVEKYVQSLIDSVFNSPT